MKKFHVFHNLIIHAWKVICQQFWLLAVLSMLFLALPMAAGPVAEELLSRGVDFSGMVFGVCTPQGDSTGVLLEELTGRMEDISRYASFRSMEEEQAAAALEAGELTAVLVLPENFIGGVLGGENPDVTLIVPADKPLESLLALWVGQSAADLLTAAQSGIYGVLDAVPWEGVEGLSWEQAKMDINLSYISMTLNRQEMFRLTRLKAVDSMELPAHYGLSLLLFLTMALAAVFCPLYADAGAPFRRRLKSLGGGAMLQYFSCFGVAFCLVLALTMVPTLLLTGGKAAGCILLALFGAAFGSVCCLLSRSAAGCGGIAIPAAGAMVFCCGGVLPMPLLPRGLRAVGEFLPVGHLRTLMYLPISRWGEVPLHLLGAAVWILCLVAIGVALYSRRLGREEL